MTLVVVDASVLTAFYSATSADRLEVLRRLERGDALYAPAHLDAEVVSALRKIALRYPDFADTVPMALAHLQAYPIRREPLLPLLDRVWELRANVTPYDAAYVALAERLEAPVLTCDARLATASGPRCSFEVIG